MATRFTGPGMHFLAIWLSSETRVGAPIHRAYRVGGGVAPKQAESGGEPLLEEMRGLGAFDTTPHGIHDAAAQDAMAVKGQPVGNVEIRGLRRNFEIQLADLEEALLENGAQDLIAKQDFRVPSFEGRREAVSREDGDELVVGDPRKDEEVERTVDGVDCKQSGVRGSAQRVAHAVKRIGDISIGDASQRAAAHAPIKGGKPGGGKRAQGFFPGNIGLQRADERLVHKKPGRLTEVNPQSDDRGEQQQAEHDVDAMFHGSFVRGFAHGGAHGDRFHLFVDGGEGKAGEALAIGRRGHQADNHQHHGTDYEHENGVVQKVHVHEPVHRGVLKLDAGSAFGNFQDKTRGAKNETRKERGDGARSVEPRPQDSENEASGDGRADVGLDALQVDVELAADVVDEGDPEEAEQHHDSGGDAPEIDELALGGLRTDFLVKVERDQSGSGIEDGAHGAHDGGEQRGHDQADESDREKIEHESRVSEIRLFHLVGEQGEGDDTRKDEHEDRQDLEESSENGSRFGMSFIAGGEYALHDDLVGAPIPDAENRGAEKDAGPGEIGIRRRLDHVKVVGRDHSAEMFETADAHKPNDGEGDSAGDEDQGLNGVGVNDRGQATCDGVDAGGNYENHRGLPERPAGNSFENHARGVELHGNFREDVGDDGNSRQINGGLAIEAAFQKLRHGEDVGAEIKGHKNPAEDQENQARQPFEMADGESRRGAGAGETNEVLGGNIGDEERSANKEPTDIAAGQEIAFGGAFLSGEVHANAEDDGEIDPDDDEVYRCQVAVRDRNLRCEEHPCLP